MTNCELIVGNYTVVVMGSWSFVYICAVAIAKPKSKGWIGIVTNITRKLIGSVFHLGESFGCDLIVGPMICEREISLHLHEVEGPM